MADAAPIAPQIIRVTEIGEFVRNESCERRFKLEANHRELARLLPFAERLFNPLDPVLQELGNQRESEWEASLNAAGLADLTGYGAREGDDRSTSWTDFIEQLRLAQPFENAYGREIAVSSQIGAYLVEGRIDFVLLLWRDGRPILRIVECKASRRDRTYHRIQLALYETIVAQLVTAVPILIGGFQLQSASLESVVARVEEDTNEVQSILDLPALDLSMELADLARLFAAEGTISRILATPLDDLDFQLDGKCDSCVFHSNCLPESGRRRSLQLLGIAPSIVRVLQSNNVISIDDLAELDVAGASATAIRRDPAFTENLPVLRTKAIARRKTLPGPLPGYEVESLPNSQFSQLPRHETGGARLVRIFVAVDFDYAENRIGALSAHVTDSDGQLNTGFINLGGRFRPNSEVTEKSPSGVSQYGRPLFDGLERPIRGREVIRFKPSPWTGRLQEDAAAEQELIQGFFQELVDTIAEVANAAVAPIHFYVWSRSEMSRLVEACSRVSSELLGHLRELLGCRESLEQLIYSCLQDEVDRRYGLGWTGRGLAVVSSLPWFGRRFHWVRRISGTTVQLDRVFQQDIFDFKTNLGLRADGEWAANERETEAKYKFEIRTRFFDTLTAPYWRAYWRTLPPPEALKPQVRNALHRYNLSARPGYLREYLRARTHALRWIEENIWPKNAEIDKPAVRIDELPSFTLGVNDVGRASIDYLRLEQHIRVNDWIATRLVPPSTRVPLGLSLPVRNVRSNGRNQLTAELNLVPFQLDAARIESSSTFSEDSFVRLCPCPENPTRGQTVRQLTSGIARTCIVTGLNWTTGQIALDVLPSDSTRYRLPSGPVDGVAPLFDFATLEENPSDFVAEKVEARLRANVGRHAFDWFDPTAPNVPENPLQAPQMLLCGLEYWIR